MAVLICLLLGVIADIAEYVASSPSKVMKLVMVTLAVMLTRPANRRHLWKGAAMGIFNKRAR